MRVIVAMSVRRTAETARTAGAQTRIVSRDATELADAITALKTPRAMVHLRGRHIAGDLANILKLEGIETHEHIIYEQTESQLNEDAIAALHLQGQVVLPVYSPRSCRLLGAQLKHLNPIAELHLVSLSAAVEDAWAGPPPASRCRAGTPDGDAMMQEIRRLMARLG